MFSFSASAKIIITCSKRLAPYLEQEVRELGFTPARTFATGVELLGTVNDCIKLNLNLCSASQVLYSLKEFYCNGPDDLYEALIRYPWENLLTPQGYFSVTSNATHFTVNNDMFVNVKVKDAIADRMRRETLKRPDSGSELSGAVFHLYWKEERAEIFLDTSGETLAKHGYRKIPGKAPMLEALAAATLRATRWDRTGVFVNPMCGSGTVAIEAAMLATNRKPGLYRKNYSFMHLTGYDAARYETELKKLHEQIKPGAGLRIIASDISDDAIKIAKVNAGIAGVEALIEFIQCDFEATPVPEAGGVLYFNPEYGERLGDVSALETTYARMGDFMKKKCPGYFGYIFTGNLELAKKIGLKASRRIEFYTSKIDCRLLEYELYGGSRREIKKEATL
ncbi:MAG: class I SAM-dependent RNA methyltransferase [Cytophagales bacterium]|nr:class I SAM-dependent RNA methyltransferase [Cytophagales bacterium]